MRIILKGVLIPLFLLGCQSIEGLDVLKDPIYEYEADLKMTVDGETHRGFGATFIAPEKTIQIDSPVKLDYLFVHSCGRFKRYPEWDQAKLGAKSVTFKYRPIEKENGECPVFFEVYNTNGITAWGMLAFRLGNEMPAITHCNGEKANFLGHSVCQSKPGIEHTIRFQESVQVKTRDECVVKEISPGAYRFRAATGKNTWCRIGFSNGEKFHFLTVHGYSRPFIRE